MSPRKLPPRQEDGLSHDEVRRHQIIDSIDAPLMSSLQTILLPQTAKKKLNHISADEGAEFAKRLGHVLDSVIRVENEEKQRYEDDRLAAALLLTAGKVAEMYRTLNIRSARSGHSVN